MILVDYINQQKGCTQDITILGISITEYSESMPCLANIRKQLAKDLYIYEL